jgi:hypothetical protein
LLIFTSSVPVGVRRSPVDRLWSAGPPHHLSISGVAEGMFFYAQARPPAITVETKTDSRRHRVSPALLHSPPQRPLVRSLGDHPQVGKWNLSPPGRWQLGPRTAYLLGRLAPSPGLRQPCCPRSTQRTDQGGESSSWPLVRNKENGPDQRKEGECYRPRCICAPGLHDAQPGHRCRCPACQCSRGFHSSAPVSWTARCRNTQLNEGALKATDNT